MATLVAECGIVASLASPLLGCAKFVFRPIYVTTVNFLNLSSNLQALQRMMQDLSHLTNQVTQQVNETVRNGGVGTHQATQWQRQATELTIIAEQIIDNTDSTRTFGGCFFRYDLSKKVSKTLREVHRLTEAYPTLLVLTQRQEPLVEHIPVVSVQDQPTASLNLSTLMGLLSQDGVTSIGVWGMGGVGKTTLLKNLNNNLSSFGKVIWITVSRETNHKLVQTKIAQRLGFDLQDSDQVSMAAQLHRRLLLEDKFLLILDDVWEPLDLHCLGIPQPQVHKGCYKIILTTRSQAVCIQMEVDQQFKLLTLDDKEAWQLFATTVGEVANWERVVSYAKAITRECGGLPLAIKVVGAAMRRKERVELWDDALNELRRSRPFAPGIEKQVFNPIKWSYDSLPDEKIKSCFLFCCLYPEDYQIDTNALVRCWVGEGLMPIESSYKDSLNRGIATIEILKQSGLLEDGKYSWTVTMHDIVRDVAIWIASSLTDGPKSLILSGISLAHIVEKVEGSESLKRVSFINNKIKNLPDDYVAMQCHEGLTLFFLGNEFSDKVAEFLLQGFRLCRVLNMTSTDIKSLPHSLMQFGNLRTLLLKGCSDLKELPALGWDGLAKLEMLDLSRTDIRKLPRGVKMLIKLCEVHLVDTKSLVSIPDGVFCMLSSLEVLNMEGSEYEWGLNEEVGDGKAHLEELESLTKLRELHITMKRKTSLNSRVDLTWISGLTSFRLVIGVKALPFGFRGARREIYIASINFSEKAEKVEYLLSSTNATSLWLHGCEGLDKMVQNWALSNIAPCSALNYLNINDCSLSSREGCVAAQYDLLPNLEHVNLNGLEGVENLSQLFAPLGLRFSKLRQLTLWHCKELKYLLSLGGLIQNLGNLEGSFVSNCSELEELFHYDNNDMVKCLPKLRRICLHYLPKLKTVCKKTGEWPRVEEIQVSECPELRKLPLTIQSKNSIQVIRGGASWWSELEWDDIATKHSLHPLFHGW